MRVITDPRRFISGTPLAPEDLNDVYNYARDAVADVAQRRWARFMVPYQWVTTVDAPYTEASGILLEHRFTCPLTCVVERAFLSADMTSAANVTVNIVKVSGGATPSGCSVPWLSTNGAVASAAEDVNLDRFQFDAGAEYKITVASTGTFTLSRFDLTLHVAVDRWTVAGVSAIPDFDPTLFTDASARDATVVAANNAALAAQVALFSAALSACAPTTYQAHNFISTTDLDVLRFMVPRFSSVRAQCVAKRLYVFGSMAAAFTGTIKAILKTQANVVLATATATFAAATQASGDSGAISVALAGAFS